MNKLKEYTAKVISERTATGLVYLVSFSERIGATHVEVVRERFFLN